MKSPELGLCGIGVTTGGGLIGVKPGIPPETELGIPNCRAVGVDDGIDEGTTVGPKMGFGDGLGIDPGVVNGCTCGGTGAGAGVGAVGRKTGAVGEGPICGAGAVTGWFCGMLGNWGADVWDGKFPGGTMLGNGIFDGGATTGRGTT